MARPQIVIDIKQLETYAKLGCTNEEMATLLGCSKDTLEMRFSAIIKSGRANLKMSLRRGQVRKALNGDNTMLIWLGKIILEQREVTEIKDDRLTALITHMNRTKEKKNEK